ncbi:MAG TPA: 3-keto-5-aminohexanoate cleavage protein [Thermoleophilia bacterium]
MARQYDWSKYPKVGMYDYTPEEMAYWPMQAVDPKWKIPPKVSIQVAISGGGARITPDQNPYHPGANLDNIYDSADEVLSLKEGPSVVHFDNDLYSLQTRDGEKMLPGDSYLYVVRPLIEKYGWDKLCTHINCLRGDLEQQMKPIVTGLCELTYTHARTSELWLRTIIPIYKENGVKAEVVAHVNSEIGLAKRILIDSGLMPSPNLWNLLFGLPVKGPRWHFEYVPNEVAMCQALVNAVQRIREIDPNPFITIEAGGRPSRYMVVLAMLLGLHIRVGMEDTVFQYPHKDDPCKNNAEEVTWAIQTARMLGREVMTPAEFREATGLRPRTGNDPDGYVM